jgi:hypothetical protein
MTQPLDLQVIASLNRIEGEKLVLIKLNELIGEINRLEQIIQFLSGDSTETMGNPDDIQ